MPRRRGVTPLLWPPFVKYLNNLLWPDVDECAAKRLRVSFAELALDFELFSGFRLEDPKHGRQTSWARRAYIFASFWKAAIKLSPNYKRWQGEFKRERVTTLQVFGVPKQPGLLRRPRLLMGYQTERLVARNALMHGGRERDPRKYQGEGFLGLAPSYEGITCKPLYEPPEHQLLTHELNLRTRAPRRRLKGKTKV